MHEPLMPNPLVMPLRAVVGVGILWFMARVLEHWGLPTNPPWLNCIGIAIILAGQSAWREFRFYTELWPNAKP